MLPQGSKTAPRRGVRKPRPRRRDARRPLDVKVTLRGGPDRWVRIEAEGLVHNFPGCTTLLEVVHFLSGWQ